jgi:hypothetical protein
MVGPRIPTSKTCPKRGALPRQHHLLVRGLILALLALALPDVALAHKPPSGVHVDPGSPAAKEYSIPLSSARGAPAGSASSGQLFGAGITRGSGGGGGGAAPSGGGASPTAASSPQASPSPAAPASPAAPTHHARAHPKTAASHRTQSVAPAPLAAGAAAANAIPPSLKVLHPSSGSGVAWMLGVAALVLLIGGLGAFVLRGRSRRVDARLG